jgi:ABC-type dipeptide/oligopeptide/nickel transport system permease subunit
MRIIKVLQGYQIKVRVKSVFDLKVEFYIPTNKVPRIDIIKIITIKIQSNIPSMILLNIITSVITAVIIKKFLSFLNRIE